MSFSANDLKEQGNAWFTSRKYKEAIGCYTKAIIHNPDMPTYYTNRALCYIKLKQWELAGQDCRRALESDSNLVKGHYFLGQALLEMRLYDEAIASLLRAHELAKDQKQNYGDDITSLLRSAKKSKFALAEQKRVKEEIELQTYLNRLITEERDRQIGACSHSLTKDALQTEVARIENEHEVRLKQVSEMFSQIDNRRQTRDVPDFLCSRISFELMRDPVVTPSGITYDRRDIEEHLQRVGHFDPVTRMPLTQDKLIPNLAMKEVIDSFLQENPWAEDY